MQPVQTPTAPTAKPDPGLNRETPQHEIVIIGAGLSGIGMAISLLREGIDDFVILERADDVGGTWRQNTYPGIGVDIPAHAYQFSYELKPDWSGIFARGDEVQAYVNQCVDNYDVRGHIRFNSEVRERVWDAAEQLWRLDTSEGEVTARYVISAIGPFVDPKPSGIPGVEDFEGKVIHAAEWDHDYDLAGKRAAIVGTGASAVQIIPKIAPVVDHLDVYQRTPIWIAPKLNPRIPGSLQSIFRRIPATQGVFRQALTAGCEFVLIRMVINHERLPFAAHAIEGALSRVWYRSQVPDAELREKLTPDYGFGCKRPAISSRYLRTFMRDDVELVTDPIERITATGVRTVSGEEREIDTLILATGFRLATDPENYRRTPVRGRDGFDLADFYADERAHSYEGISLPRLPNHFMMFGPYGWVGGTWHELVETTSAHIVRVVREAQRRGATEVEVSEEATAAWTEMAREKLSKSLWHGNRCETANSYYFDAHGDTPFLRPTTAGTARRAAKHFPLDDYSFSGPR